MKKMLSSLLIILISVLSIGLTAKPASASTTYLPANIRHHVWTRLTDGSQGGYHDHTTFKGNHLTINEKATGLHYHWRFTGLKKANKTTYYGRLHYSKSNSSLVKIKIFSSKHFDIIPKHMQGLKGSYTSNEQYGATIFKR